MHFKIFAAIGVTALILGVPLRADAGCCDKQAHQGHDMKMACCSGAAQEHKMACCETPAPDAKMECCDKEVDVLALLAQQSAPAAPAAPAQQTVDVWFKRPTIIGKSILQGHYVILHDNERMARGEPCTYIYAYDDRVKPVLSFYCVHLERDTAAQNTVTVKPRDNGWQELKEFQFAGERAAHGVPAVR
jgi:hypothetical protein